jgi:hypothetical protein
VRARFNAAECGTVASCSYWWRRERGTMTAPWATRTPACWSASHACSPPACLWARRRFTLTVVRCTGTPPRDIDDGFLPRRRVPPLLPRHLRPPSSTATASSAQRRPPPPTSLHGQRRPLPLSMPGSGPGGLRSGLWIFFIFKKRFLLSVGNNQYHKEVVFRIGQIVSVATKGFYSSGT